MSASSNLAGDVKSSARWGIVLGILTALLGLLFIAYPLFGAAVSTIIIGWTLIFAGAFEVIQAFYVHTVGAFFARLLLGFVYGFGGLVLLVYPLRGVAVLTVMLGIMLLFEAAATTVLAFRVKPISGWGWLFFDAVITAILGCLILAHWPASSIWAIGTLVGVALLMRGITRIALSTRMRSVAKRVEEISVRPRHAA
jgi:uncharacterized membrane protein HdeD (DUF308 family)